MIWSSIWSAFPFSGLFCESCKVRRVEWGDSNRLALIWFVFVRLTWDETGRLTSHDSQNKPIMRFPTECRSTASQLFPDDGYSVSYFTIKWRLSRPCMICQLICKWLSYVLFIVYFSWILFEFSTYKEREFLKLIFTYQTLTSLPAKSLRSLIQLKFYRSLF